MAKVTPSTPVVAQIIARPGESEEAIRFGGASFDADDMHRMYNELQDLKELVGMLAVLLSSWSDEHPA